MQQSTVKAKPRESAGTPAVKKLRNAGGIPGVVYGRTFGDPLPIIVDAKDLRAALISHGGSAVLNLEIEGRGSTPAIVQDRQLDVVTKRLIHIDLHAISLDEVVEAHVPIVLVGAAPGVKEGGILDFVVREVTVESLPTDIPDSIEVDISALNMFDNVHVRDIKAPAGVKIVEDEGEIVVSILPPSKVEEVVATAVPEVPLEPELIGEKKPAAEEPEAE
ncbi:MAG TPA: 50S ribosomal protein L25 [Candidatus Eremiobacteraceae bacterium]|jgi:large subunit ribosomal protein L25|nr:50S ribosomal protein L25 [Candidatus Eremiobacteraceae bacterium]